MDILHGVAIFSVAAVAGIINAVAGGGTLLTFPALIWSGLSPVTANVTSAAALWPGLLGGLWGYKKELRQSEPKYFALVIPSLLGGLVGGALLRLTPPATFALLVPFLILFATLLFMAQEPLQRRLARNAKRGDVPSDSPVAKAHRPSFGWIAKASGAQFLSATYGGYFGAGNGIIMLATLSLLGVKSIHHMNALKTLFAIALNFSAIAYFAYSGLIRWPEALVMAAGALIGGYGGAVLARRLGSTFVRRTVIAIGFAMTISLLFKLT
jgi:uncharacterized protein